MLPQLVYTVDRIRMYVIVKARC